MQLIWLTNYIKINNLTDNNINFKNGNNSVITINNNSITMRSH